MITAGLAREAPNELSRRVLAEILPGHAKARTATEIGRAIGCSERLVRRVVQTLIADHGAPVASSTSEPPLGLFLLTSEAERSRYLSQLGSRVREIQDRLDAIRRCRLHGADSLAAAPAQMGLSLLAEGEA